MPAIRLPCHLAPALALTALLLNYQGEPDLILGRWGFQLMTRTTRPPREVGQPTTPEPVTEPA